MGFCLKVIFFFTCPTICLANKAFSTTYIPTICTSVSNSHLKLFSPHGVGGEHLQSSTEPYNIMIAWKHPGFVIPRRLLAEKRKRGSASTKNPRSEDDTRKLHNNATLSTSYFQAFYFPNSRILPTSSHTEAAAGSSRESRVRSSDLCPWPVLGGACKSVKATTGKTCTSWCWVGGYKSAVWLDTRRCRVDFLRHQEILGLPETAVKGMNRGNNNHTILLQDVWAFEDLFVDCCIQSFKVVALTQLQY